MLYEDINNVKSICGSYDGYIVPFYLNILLMTNITIIKEDRTIKMKKEKH